VKDGAKLTFLPHMLILGATASLSQRIRIHLAAEASLNTPIRGARKNRHERDLAIPVFEYCLELFRADQFDLSRKLVPDPDSFPMQHPLIVVTIRNSLRCSHSANQRTRDSKYGTSIV